jgi:hypothetical protein
VVHYELSEVAELRDAAEQLASLLAADDIFDIGPLLREVLNSAARELEQAIATRLEASAGADESPLPASFEAFVVEWALPRSINATTFASRYPT